MGALGLEPLADAERATNFTKTAFRPYDLAVTAFLLIAKHHLGPELTIETDARTAQWDDAGRLCSQVLGFSEGLR